jgi:hypothetical protein
MGAALGSEALGPWFRGGVMLGGMRRWLMWIGGGLFIVGLSVLSLSKAPWAERLPSDVAIGRDNFTLYAPAGTMILLSVVLTLVLNLIIRLRR